MRTSGIPPIVNMDSTEVGQRGGHGLEAAVLDIEDEGGLSARFWVRVYINKNGRPVASVSTKPDKHMEKQVTKSVTGTFNRL